MSDLTQFFGKQGIVLDKNLAFTNTSKSNADLIKEMQSNAKWLSSVLSPVRYGKSDTKLTLNGGDKPIEIKWQQ